MPPLALQQHSAVYNNLPSADRWQYEGEKAMREAAENGLAYTVVRPGSLTDKARPKDASLVRRGFTRV